MATQDAAVVAEMARELAAALDDPDPVLDPNDIVRDGMGPERWLDGLVAVLGDGLVVSAIVCRGYGPHIGTRRLWLRDPCVCAPAPPTGAQRPDMAGCSRV